MVSLLTFLRLKPVNKRFDAITSQQLLLSSKPQILDRYGESLTATYQNEWNYDHAVNLEDIPLFLQHAFIYAEDKRFYQHSGIDWSARFSALFSNIRHLKSLRGASTITEQCVKNLQENTRSRSIWSRWLEGFEAQKLSKHASKKSILSFYLNQVPYASNRRGVVQAAHYYFNRDLSTLSKKEMLALAVLVRAPSRFDLYKSTKRPEKRIQHLADILYEQKIITQEERKEIRQTPLHVSPPKPLIFAPHAISYIRSQQPHNTQHKIQSTLDGTLQIRLQELLNQHVKSLLRANVNNGALLVANHQTSEILAWVVSGERGSSATNKTKQSLPFSHINAVISPRQPGSTLKPFVYARALEKGWTAAQHIVDEPLSEWVSHGLHEYNNYSNHFYGLVSMRQALANSLNIPAVKTLRYVGGQDFLTTLHQLGMQSLTESIDFYGDGLVLGNGEVSLLEMVQAYSVLANKGQFKTLRIINGDDSLYAEENYPVFSQETSSIIANILSDDNARLLEFGQGGILNFPIQTAVKTGTSSDYNDSWTLAFNDKYTVGVWLGNIDRKPMKGVSGAKGAALLVRNTFSLLNKNRVTQPLYRSANVQKKRVCIGKEKIIISPDKEERCERSYWELFRKNGHNTSQNTPLSVEKSIQYLHISDDVNIRLRQPVQGLHIAYDPRIPAKIQRFTFLLQGAKDKDYIEWDIDGKRVTEATLKRPEKIHQAHYSWQIERGGHHVQATVFRQGKPIHQTPIVYFLVK